MDTKPTKPLEFETPWLHPDHLMSFLDELREAGFAVGVSDYVKVHQLVVGLLANSVELQQPEQFGRYLGPLLCSSEIEQIEFQQRFANWIAPLKAAANARKQNQAGETRQEELEPIRKRSRMVRIFVILAVLSLIFAALAFLISQNITHVPEVIIPQPPLIIPYPDNSLLPPELVWADNPDRNSVLIMGVMGLLSLVLLVIFGVIFVRWLADQYLERHSTKETPQLDTISIAHDTEALFPAIAFFRLAQRMRRRVRVASPELDINATLQHTLSQGGWLMPVRGTRLQVPEYLVLIDRTTFRDHQTRLIKEMVAQLTEHEVFASIFFFDRDPRVCYPADGKTRGVTLQVLTKSHPDHRLLLFADAQHLFHPLKNELAGWTGFFSAWSERVLLTTKSREHWGYYETELQSVMTVLPATADSLTNFVMGDLLASGRQDSKQTRPPLPRLLAERPYRWLSRDKPDEGLIEDVLLGLRAYLDRAGFFWLCACAIFPKLQWNITLYLGQQLKTDEGTTLLSYDRLVELARLPWFRHGYMPDWFRRYLISTLTPAQEGDARQTLQTLLLNVVSGPVGPHPLEIARPLDFWSRSILRFLARHASEDSLFQDYIFRTYVADNKRLSIRMPIHLRDRLLSGDRRSLDWAIWRQWTIAHALGGTLISLMGFFSLKLGSFLIDKYGASPLWLLVIALVVFSSASLQVWAGRRRIEPDWSAFRSSLGGMAFTHVSIVILFVALLLFDEWVFHKWPFWALVGAVIGLSDSLGRYLFSNKRNVNGPARLKPYGSVVGFTIGFVLLNWWHRMDILPPIFWWLGAPFVIWTCYGMATGVALVWGNPNTISIQNIWSQVKTWWQEVIESIKNVPIPTRNTFLRDWLLANLTATILLGLVNNLFEPILFVLISGGIYGYAQSFVLKRHTNWSSGWLYAVLAAEILEYFALFVSDFALIGVPLSWLLSAIPEQWFFSRKFNDRRGWLVVNFVAGVIVAILNLIDLNILSFLAIPDVVGILIIGLYLLRYVGKSTEVSETERSQSIFGRRSLMHALGLPRAKRFLIVWTTATVIGFALLTQFLVYITLPNDLSYLIYGLLFFCLYVIIIFTSLSISQLLVFVLYLKINNRVFTTRWFLSTSLGIFIGFTLGFAVLTLISNEQNRLVTASVMACCLGFSISITRWFIALRPLSQISDKSLPARRPLPDWIIWVTCNTLANSLSYTLLFSILNTQSSNTLFSSLATFALPAIPVIISGLMLLMYLPEEWFEHHQTN